MTIWDYLTRGMLPDNRNVNEKEILVYEQMIRVS